MVSHWADFAQHDASFFVLILGLVHALAQRIHPPENDQAVVGGVGSGTAKLGEYCGKSFLKRLVCKNT